MLLGFARPASRRTLVAFQTFTPSRLTSNAGYVVFPSADKGCRNALMRPRADHSLGEKASKITQRRKVLAMPLSWMVATDPTNREHR